MANYRYTYDYNGRRYEIDAPKGSTAADLQRIVDGSSRRAAPVAERRDTRVLAPQSPPKKEDRGLIGRAYDAVFGEPEAPKPYTAEGLTSRQRAIADRRARLLTQAEQLEARAKITPGRIDRGPDQAQALRDGAKSIRGEVAALDRELAKITETGAPVPEANILRETLSAAPRTAYTAVSSFPGVVTAATGRGLGAVEGQEAGLRILLRLCPARLCRGHEGS